MTSVEALLKLEPLFERLVKPIDLYLLIEHVRRIEPRAFARHFKGYRAQSLGRKRVVKSLAFEVFTTKNEIICDILILLWNQTRRDIYDAMHDLVSTINEDVESITEIPDERANAFIDVLSEDFELDDILICVTLNDVRFNEPVIRQRLMGEVSIPAAVETVAGVSAEQKNQVNDAVADV
jgi:hypothetical protein